VWRNEKPGPGRFREFTQFDVDTVGSASPAADAELVMITADALEALGLSRGEYMLKLNSRKLLDGVLEAAEIAAGSRGVVLRAIDKMDRLGPDGVGALLGRGRKDESGDFTEGAKLAPAQIERVLQFALPAQDGGSDLSNVARAVDGSANGMNGVENLRDIERIVRACGYGDDRVQIDTGIVRGLEYYTGLVFEAQARFQVTNEAGEAISLGSLAGGGRYDDLVARFTGQQVPAVGVSIGVSRFLTALRSRGLGEGQQPLIVVLVLDRPEIGESFRLAQMLRNAGMRAEAYTGDSGMKAQLKYCDKRGAAFAIIEGTEERAKGEVTIKDLALGAELAKNVESRAAWVEGRPAQHAVPRDRVVEHLRLLMRNGGKA
jgi:histidyl-tRNA synthetase